MKKVFPVLLALAIVVTALLLVKKENERPGVPAPQTQSPTNDQARQPASLPPSGEGNNVLTNGNRTISTDITSQTISSNPSTPTTGEAQTLVPLTVLDNARVAMHNYCATFGENPVGNNAEITAALMGKNPKGINFIRDGSGLTVNSNGELVDGYGTPFFFHQLSGTVMEIRSAGQDRRMWTPDDEVKR